MTQKITVEALVDAPLNKVWTYWNSPSHITNWNAASEDWCCPKAEVDLKVGGFFTARMEAKDGSFGFDFKGEYKTISEHNNIVCVMEDGRMVDILFKELDGKTQVIETFDPETENPLDMQQAGWQAILNNFKQYTENN